VKKRGDNVSKVKENIKSDIAQYIQSLQEKREDAREEVPPTPKPVEETSSGGSLLPIVALALFALLMACIVFFYIRMWLPMDRKVHDLKGELKDTKNRLSDLADELHALKLDHSNLKSEKEELDNELRQLSRKQKSAPTEYESTSQPSKPANCDFYAGIPTNGSFEVRDSYKPGNSIYVLHTSGNSGTYELVQRDEVLRIVRKSRTSYIEPACNILSESEVFSNVKTEKPGRVCLDGDRWRIVEKASVRLV
ncbi:MAG: hypothetical protein KBT04_05420, partial [Bacteroidales bacterium]|nr:hypothetical protein [Candidatus Colimorpha onthohippi]